MADRERSVVTRPESVREPEPPPVDAPVEVADATSRKASWARRLWWIHSIYALGLGVFVAVYAGREFSYARWLLLTIVAVWVVLVAIYRLFGQTPEVHDQALARKVGFHAMTWVLKNLYQGMLFFLLPFYFRSATFGTMNQWFVVGLALCALIATLDIVFDRVLMRFRLAATVYFVVTMFATLNLSIPALLPGVDAFYGLVGASLVSVLVVWFIQVPRWQWSDPGPRLALATGLVGAIMFSYVARPLVPPVPHHLIYGAVGPAEDGRLLVHAKAIHSDALTELVAETRILAPDGADSSFRHVWRHEKVIVHTVDEPGRTTFEADPNALLIRSTLPTGAMPKPAFGKWTVDIETDSGRLIGRVRFKVLK